MASTDSAGFGSEGVHFQDARGPDNIRLYAIGDIHGRLDLLKRMHMLIAEEIERDAVPDWRIIHLGDYVDRGPDSRGVLDFLVEACARDDRNLTIAGNHDFGVIEFLMQPNPDSLFIQYGGIQTARSYGVTIDLLASNWLEQAGIDFKRAFPSAHERLIRESRLSVGFGDFFFCHAGIRPSVPLDAQDPSDLIWIREPFFAHRGLYPKVIVHGHTIVDEPLVLPNRVDLDTGAWRSGVLSALVVDGKRKRLLRAEA